MLCGHGGLNLDPGLVTQHYGKGVKTGGSGHQPSSRFSERLSQRWKVLESSLMSFSGLSMCEWLTTHVFVYQFIHCTVFLSIPHTKETKRQANTQKHVNRWCLSCSSSLLQLADSAFICILFMDMLSIKATRPIYWFHVLEWGWGLHLAKE